MKSIKTWLLVALILITLLLLTYLGIAFVYLKFNFYDWNQGQRELLVFMGFVLILFSPCVYIIIED